MLPKGRMFSVFSGLFLFFFLCGELYSIKGTRHNFFLRISQITYETRNLENRTLNDKELIETSLGYLYGEISGNGVVHITSKIRGKLKRSKEYDFSPIHTLLKFNYNYIIPVYSLDVFRFSVATGVTMNGVVNIREDQYGFFPEYASFDSGGMVLVELYPLYRHRISLGYLIPALSNEFHLLRDRAPDSGLWDLYTVQLTRPRFYTTDKRYLYLSVLNLMYLWRIFPHLTFRFSGDLHPFSDDVKPPWLFERFVFDILVALNWKKKSRGFTYPR